MLSRTAQVAEPDGDIWHVRAYRVRLPEWRQIELWYDPIDERDLLSLLINLVLMPFTLLLVPLLFFLAKLPGAFLAARGSDVRWVEAACYWPHEERYLWRTARGDVPAVRASVIEMLSAGKHVAVPRAELVEHQEVVDY